MLRIKNKRLINFILITLSLILVLSFGFVLFQKNVNSVRAVSEDVEIQLDDRVNKVTSSSTPTSIDLLYFDVHSDEFASIDYKSTYSRFNSTNLHSSNYFLLITLPSTTAISQSGYSDTIYCYFSYISSLTSTYVRVVNNLFTGYDVVNSYDLRLFLTSANFNKLITYGNYFIITIKFNSSDDYFTISSPALSYAYSSSLNSYDAGKNEVINNPNDYNLYTDAQYRSAYINGKNEVINNPSNYNLYTKEQYDSNYTAGYNAGIINSDNYNTGYNAGKNDVINNPNDYNLYDDDQYNNNYNLGFNNGKYDVINNPSNYNLYTKEQYDNNYTVGYNAAKNDFTGLGIFSYVTYYNYAKGIGNNADYLLSTGRLNSNNVTYYNGGFYNDKTLRTELENYLDENSSNYNGGYLSLVFDTPISTTRYYSFVVRGFEFGNSIEFYFDDNSTLEFNRADNFNIDSINLNGLNKNIIKIDLIFANADYLTFGLSANTLVEDSYNTGYNDGKGSVDTANIYNSGYNAGYNVGKNDGLIAGKDYTFIGLIGAVVDAPIKAFTSLFNFNLLGFNLLNFITALFTICVIVTIVRLCIGGK